LDPDSKPPVNQTTMTKPPILRSIEEQLGFSLRLVEGQDLPELMKYRNRNTCAQNEEGEVTGLNLRTNDLTDDQIDFLRKLTQLQALNLSENNISQITFPSGMDSLRYLNLSENSNLQKVTFECEMPELEKLDLNESAVRRLTLPAGCQKLQLLDLRKNGLETINFEGGCPAMTMLDLSENKLASLTLPAGFGELTYLYLNDNQLESLTFQTTLSQLKTLHLRNNQLKQLPEGLMDMQNLEALYLHGNPLPELDPAILPENERENSAGKVRDYLRELGKGRKPNHRVKVIIVGNGRVGKTSMYRRLKGLPFNPKEKYTHGVQLGKLTEENLPEVKTVQLEANVWDFGGQEIFYATHQFFLSEDALYLLAWTERQKVEAYRKRDKDHLPFDEKWRSREYWLENIPLRGRSSPILMVQTHIDKGEPIAIDEPSYRKPPYEAECLNFGAAENLNLSWLKRSITRKLNEAIPHFGKDFPETYDGVIEEIERLREKENKHVIPLEKFYEVCSRAKITEGGEESVLDYLRKTGLVVYFGGRDKPLLRDTVYIDPNWLTREVYKLINNDLRERAGRIEPDYLRKTLPGYSEEERARFIELLKNFELIFEAFEEEGVFIAPQYLPGELVGPARQGYEMIREDLTHSFTFRFSKFVPDNVMINFLSRYGPFSRRMYWRTGICFSARDKAKCIVHFKEKEKRLVVLSEDSERGHRIQYEVCRAFVELGKNANAEISTDGERFVSWQRLVESEEKGINKIITTDGKEAMEVGDFYRFLKDKDFPAMGYKGLEAIDETNPKKIFFSYSKRDREYLEELHRHLSPLRRQGKVQPWDDGDMRAGEEWDREIKRELYNADIILLLVSANFLSTDYVWDVEIKAAMELHEAGKSVVIPVILEPCDWVDLPFSKLQGLPDKGTPVGAYQNRNEAWLEVVNGIKKVLKSMKVR